MFCLVLNARMEVEKGELVSSVILRRLEVTNASGREWGGL